MEKKVACFGVTAEGRHVASIHHVPLKKHVYPQQATNFCCDPKYITTRYGYTGDKSVFAAGSGKTAACWH